eukprot:CAMPEP_0198702932 /NCGR_PEP_ID=MMETSP1468-20131203/389047_1 /TAXON_ID=1461545 /ORGANISM="Mantoniella sp, Strain CCMP1436" /LENGTH=143 /DNA_ID=CAMNT_0044461547 /DNA_START=1346 /DNA_END=1777 /DNA_ORIENTATION=-
MNPTPFTLQPISEEAYFKILLERPTAANGSVYLMVIVFFFVALGMAVHEDVAIVVKAVKYPEPHQSPEAIRQALVDHSGLVQGQAFECDARAAAAHIPRLLRHPSAGQYRAGRHARLRHRGLSQRARREAHRRTSRHLYHTSC